jgi:CheY-like chemotaxis protein
MVVDDGLESALLLKAVLRRAGFLEVDVRTDPVSAVDACRHSAPDVLITDLRMPGMNGLEMLDALRRALPASRFPATMIVSGDDAPETIRQAMDRGADGFMLKPIDIDALVAWVRRTVELRRRAA